MFSYPVASFLPSDNTLSLSQDEARRELTRHGWVDLGFSRCGLIAYAYILPCKL